MKCFKSYCGNSKLSIFRLVRYLAPETCEQFERRFAAL